MRIAARFHFEAEQSFSSNCADATGMPADKQVWLKTRDRIESTIEKLGTLRSDIP
jgi:hypothetical protein